MPIPLQYSQLEFRIRNDDGSETGATWVAASNTNATLNTDTNYRVRFQLLVSGAGFTDKTFNLYYKLNSGSYTAIGSGQAVKYSLSSNFANGSDTTRQLTDFTGTYYYLTDNNGMCESSGATLSGAASNYWELEYCIQIDGAYVANNDTISLRVYNGSSALNTYTNTPTITVSDGGSPDALTATDISSGVPAVDKPTIGQKHALTGTDIASGIPAVDKATLGQKHVLTSTDIVTPAPVVDKPALTQIHALTSKDVLSGVPTVDKPTIGQVHALVAVDIKAGAPIVDKPTLWAVATTDDLTAQDIFSGIPIISKPTLRQIYHRAPAEELPIVFDEDEEEIIAYAMEYMF